MTFDCQFFAWLAMSLSLISALWMLLALLIPRDITLTVLVRILTLLAVLSQLTYLVCKG